MIDSYVAKIWFIILLEPFEDFCKLLWRQTVLVRIRLGLHVRIFRDHRALNCEVINLRGTSRIRSSLPRAITDLDDEKTTQEQADFFYKHSCCLLYNMFYKIIFIKNLES